MPAAIIPGNMAHLDEKIAVTTIETSALAGARLKTVFFVIAGINSFATTLYAYYLFFFLQERFGFSNQLNLIYAAWSGAVYVVFSVYGGRFAQKRGYISSLRLGLVVMLATLLVGHRVETALGHALVLGLWTLGMSFTWPALEALVSGNETRAGLSRMVGLYNLVWAGTSALAYFTGGALLQKLGPNSMFLIPAGLHGLQLALLFWLNRPAPVLPESADASGLEETAGLPLDLPPHPRAKAFLRMAWLANPFAYVAINSLIPMIPSLAKKLALTPMLAGFFCSIWLFARLLAFAGLWLWPGWHYRFRWLSAAYLAMVLCFVLLLLTPNWWIMVLAQVVFGLAIGLIYYSSLYYSMDVGEAKGEHGGLHEAAIGAGNFAGPAIGAGAMQFFPHYAQGGTWSVGGLLLVGLAVLLMMGGRGRSAECRVQSAE